MDRSGNERPYSPVINRPLADQKPFFCPSDGQYRVRHRGKTLYLGKSKEEAAVRLRDLVTASDNDRTALESDEADSMLRPGGGLYRWLKERGALFAELPRAYRSLGLRGFYGFGYACAAADFQRVECPFGAAARAMAVRHIAGLKTLSLVVVCIKGDCFGSQSDFHPERNGHRVPVSQRANRPR